MRPVKRPDFDQLGNGKCSVSDGQAETGSLSLCAPRGTPDVRRLEGSS